MQDKGTFLLWVRDLLWTGTSSLYKDRFNKEIKLNPSQIRRVNLS
jgi:hypothetical protein